MKKKFFLYCLFVFLLNVTMFAQDNYNDFILQLESENYYLSCYFDVLKSENREIMINTVMYLTTKNGKSLKNGLFIIGTKSFSFISKK